MIPPSSSEFIIDSAMLLGSGDALVGVESGQHKLDATRAHCGALAWINLERLRPSTGNTLESVGIFLGGQQVADFDLHPFGEDVDDFVQAVFVDIFLENDLNGFADDGIDNL